MKPRFIVTKVCNECGDFNIRDTKLERYASECGIDWVKKVYHLDDIEGLLYWGDYEEVCGDFKEINLPLEAYLLLN